MPLLVADGSGTVIISSVNGGASCALDVGEVDAGDHGGRLAVDADLRKYVIQREESDMST